MAIIVFPAEMKSGEKRCALLPINVKAYKLLGADVLIEAGLGQHINILDAQFVEACAKVVANRSELLQQGDIVLSLHKLSAQDVNEIKSDALIVSYLDPFNEPGFVDTLCAKGVTSISMEMIPRISRCQKMDA